MAESYSVRAILSAKDSGFSSTLGKCTSLLDKMDSKISSFSFGVFAGAGQAAFSAVKNSVTDLIGEINSSSKAWKTFEGNMSILGKDKAEIKAVKGELQDYATQTIYSASDMASSYAQLAAVGTKDANKLVKGFGGLAAAAENPAQAMKTLSQQGVQMAAKPTVAWQDFKLMLEQTPAGMAAVAKHMGMTASELVTAIQDEEVATKDFFAAVQAVGNSDSFSKLATEYKSVDQAMDGLKETVSNKLQPAFDVLSKKGITAISGLVDKLGKIDGEKIASKVSALYDKIAAGIAKCKPYVTAFKEAFSGVGTSISTAYNAIKGSLGKLAQKFGSTESVDGFKGAMESVANVITKVADFCTKHSDKIAKFIEYLPAIVIGLKGFKIARTVAPGLFSFASGLGQMAAQGISGLASKLFGVSKGTKETGTSAAASAKQLLAAGAAFLMIGAGVLLAAVGFALLAQSAIALSDAGGLAIGVMAGLVIGLAGLTIGVMLLLKSMASTSASVLPAAVALLAVGGAVLLVAVGFALMAQSSIALAAAGWGAIGVMIGMVAVMALLAVGAALLGTALTAGAVGFLAFGAAVLMVGAGFALIGVAALLAASALSIIATVLPLIAATGLQGAVSLYALGASLTVFAIGAALAGAAALVLGAGLLLMGTGILLAGTGMLLLGTGAILAATSLQMISAILPALTEHGLTGAGAIAVLGAALLAFGAGALVAGAGAIVFGAGLLVAAVGVVGLAVGIAALAIGVAAAALSMALAAGGLALLNLALPMTIANGTAASVAMLALSVGLLTLGAGALVAGAGILVLGAGMLVASVGIIAFGVAMLTASAGMLVMLAAVKGVASSVKTIAKSAKSAEKSLKTMQKSVKVVESGLNALGSKATAAMNKLTSAFNNTAGKVKTAGKKVGKGFTEGMKSGLNNAPNVAKTVVNTVNAALMSGYSAAFAAGAYISRGFALGMHSCLGEIERAAARMAAAADKAIRAEAKIHSPSKIATDDGRFVGKGYANGLLDMVKTVWNAAEKLFTIPTIATPDLAMAYSGEMVSEYDYYRQAEYTIEVPLAVDGREFAKATVSYTQDELDKKQKREDRKHGRV